MAAPRRDNARGQAGEVGKASGNQRRDHTSVVECNGALFVETPHLSTLFDRPHRNIMRDVERLIAGGAIDALNPERISYLDSMGRAQEAYRLSERDALVLMPFIGGKRSMEGQARLVDEFLYVRQQLRASKAMQADPAWIEAREVGKADRRDLTDVVQALCLRAQERGDSTTPLRLWETAATRVVTSALFETNGESIKAIRDRLTARQLRRLGLAEETYTRAVDSLLDTDAHHRAINEQGKVAVLAFAAATGGREVPGVDPVARRILRHAGFIHPQLVGLLAVAVPALVAVLAAFFGGA